MAGEAECQFNTNCWVRGRMVAMTGTFSGTFKADEVDIVDYANIRNGAVSSYTQFSRKKLPGETAIMDMEWVVPASPFGTLVTFTIPLGVRISAYGSIVAYRPPRITIYKNGAVLWSDDWRLPTGALLHLFLSLRFIDFDIPRTDPVTYRIVFQNGECDKYNRETNSNYVTQSHKISTKGKVLTSIRKK